MNAFLRAMLAVLDITQGRPQKSTSSIREHQHPDDQGHPHAPVSVTVRSELQLPQAVIDAYKADQDKQAGRDYRDALRLGVETAVLFAVLVAGWLAYVQIKATRQAVEVANLAVETARRQLEVTDRPWIKIVDVRPRRLDFIGPDFDPPKVGTNQAFLNIWVDIQNLGHSVATQVNADVFLMLPLWKNGWGDEIPAIADKVCATAQAGGSITTLFPNDRDEIAMGVGQFLNTGTINQQTTPSGTKRLIVPMLIGCIDYRFGSSATHHQTRFVYTLSRAEDRNRFFAVGETLSENQILMIRERSHDRAN